MLTKKSLPRPRERGLMLSRRRGETIELTTEHGARIVITQMGDRRLHIAASPDVKILRGELAERLRAAAAAESIPEAA